MNFMVRTSYPYLKFNEVNELHNKTEARPHSVHTQGVFIRTDMNHGWESYAIYEVDEGKDTEFTQWINNILSLFRGIEGFSAQVDIVFKAARPTRG
ncbi:MAG TPA: hypothetical protein G4O18_05345 [Dehalococcoidia bacterium]|nr:hypothetical protein [Dehalococcoidia bacterium]